MLFINTCWNLTGADTIQRETASMDFAHQRWPQARGRLLYHEYKPGIHLDIPGAEQAWRFLLSDQEKVD